MSDPSATLWPGDLRFGAEPALRGSGLAFSLAIHLMVATLAILWPLWEGPRIDLSQAFMVSLVSEPPASPAAAPRGRPVVEPQEAKESEADAKVVGEPAAKAEKEAPAAEKALAPKKAEAAKLDEAVARIRSRLRREAALESAISQMRRKVAPGEETASGVIAGEFTGGRVPLSFSLYYEAVWERIRSNWALPSLESRGLKAVVALRIARDGAIERIELENGSGDERFDRSALSAVRAANPLPPLPGDYLGRWHEVGIRFHQ
jgi:colicin import membrane protein